MTFILQRLARALAASVGLSIILICVQIASAQETRGTIRGTVTDPNGQAVPNAAIQIIDPSRGTKVNLATNGEGFYQAAYLFPGTYQIIVEASGFKKSIHDNVILQINAAVQIDIPLEVGGAQETVNVSADVPQLNTENASLGQVVDAKRLEDLPLVHGDPYTLIGLSPGATYTGSTRLDRPFEPTHIVGFAVDGVRGNRMDLTIDGAPSTATANANEVISSYVPPSDIVQEFKVQTATFDAQFGNTEGAVTSISIKSGTNALHGSTYYFAEPGSWAANDFFGNSRGQARPETKSDRFGGYISGPVRIPWLYNGKNKTFFLFGYEGIRDSRPRFDATNVWVPTDALKNGDFSAYLPANCVAPACSPVLIYDPATRVASGSNYVGTAFSGNIIPSDRINPVSKAILQYLGSPKSSGLLGNIFDSTLTEKTKPYDNFTFRVDQNINDKNHLFVRGSWYQRNSVYNDYTATEYSGVNFLFKARQGVIDDVHSFNSSTFLNIRYGYNRFIRGQNQEPDAQGFDLTKLWGPTAGATYNGLIAEAIRRFPRFDFPSPGTLGSGMSNEFRPVDTHSFAAILNKTIEKHSLKFGGELRIYREDDSFESNDQTGWFTFNNTYTRQATSSSGTDVNGLQSFAAFLLGLPSTQAIVRRADYSEYSKTYGLFVHDDWKVNQKLTLNLGIRYELETPLVERQNKSVSGFDLGYTQPFEATVKARLAANPIAGVDPNTFTTRGGLLYAGLDTGKGLYKTPKNTWLPRIGAAFRFDDKTVIRGGFGLFAGFLGERRGDVLQQGFTRTTTLATTTLPSGAIIPQSISLFPSLLSAPGGILEPVGNAQGKQSGVGADIAFFNQNPKLSKQARWQVGIQRELPLGFVAEAVYVGNYGYDIEIVRNINALPNSFLIDANFLSPEMIAQNTYLTTTTGLQNPFIGFTTGGISGLTGSTISRDRLFRPFPEFGNILTTTNDGRSWYHAGQFSLQKRYSHGYTVQAAYTWSKWLQATELLNPADPKPTKMISDQDSPHRFSLSAIYALPFGKGQPFLKGNAVLDRFVGGWQLQGVYQFQTGFPVAFGSFNLTTGATSGDLFYNGGDIAIPSDKRTTAAWFNTSVFTTASAAQPNAYHLRTLPFRFSDVRRDNINNFDFSVLKNTRINESMRIQLRFELINAFNEPYFPAPVTTPTAGNFGQVAATSANQDNYARRAQIGIKFLF